ncbi:hypothetical protein MUP32_06705 [Candidatus Microgenomates bacterium]|nr:hypothetical protein [Candidatus Microgenomates bacterium]
MAIFISAVYFVVSLVILSVSKFIFPLFKSRRFMLKNKNKILLLIIFIILFLILAFYFSQKKAKTGSFIIDDFSNDYYGKLQMEKPEQTSGKGSIAIYNKKTRAEIIKVDSEKLAITLHKGKVKANILELPYGEQSVIIYDDFNFDGLKDFAIMDGQKSCYHGPSFKIYLARDANFIFNEDFTRLAQEYCGMFQVNKDEKKIYTVTKSGCCWHESSEFAVENNKPKAVSITTEDITIDHFKVTTTKKLINGNWEETTEKNQL